MNEKVAEALRAFAGPEVGEVINFHMYDLGNSEEGFLDITYDRGFREVHNDELEDFFAFLVEYK